MSGMFGQTGTFRQENGADIELVVFGDEWYARYETKSGYSVMYDEQRGLFCYAAVRDGRFESTGVAVTEDPPPNVQPHMIESDAIRQAKVAERQRARQMPPAN